MAKSGPDEGYFETANLFVIATKIMYCSLKKHNKTDASDISCLKQIILYSSFTLDIQKMVQCIAMQGFHLIPQL